MITVITAILISEKINAHSEKRPFNLGNRKVKFGKKFNFGEVFYTGTKGLLY